MKLKPLIDLPILIEYTIDNNRKTVELLLECGFDVNIKSHKSNTSLIIASKYGHIEIIKLLLEYRADIKIKDRSNRTALDIAKELNNTEIIKLLEAYEDKE